MAAMIHMLTNFKLEMCMNKLVHQEYKSSNTGEWY